MRESSISRNGRNRPLAQKVIVLFNPDVTSGVAATPSFALCNLLLRYGDMPQDENFYSLRAPEG
jgi:hypothetical protein